jgi:hypothetical protein
MHFNSEYNHIGQNSDHQDDDSAPPRGPNIHGNDLNGAGDHIHRSRAKFQGVMQRRIDVGRIDYQDNDPQSGEPAKDQGGSRYPRRARDRATTRMQCHETYT